MGGETIHHEMLVEVAQMTFRASMTYAINGADGGVDGFFATIVDATQPTEAVAKLRRVVAGGGNH